MKLKRLTDTELRKEWVRLAGGIAFLLTATPNADDKKSRALLKEGVRRGLSDLIAVDREQKRLDKERIQKT